jgi:hypothetical protein
MQHALKESPRMGTSANVMLHNLCGPAYASMASGNLDVVMWLRSNAGESFPWDTVVCSRAAENCQVDVLKWARSQDPPCAWGVSFCSSAAENVFLEMLKWARS